VAGAAAPRDARAVRFVSAYFSIFSPDADEIDDATGSFEYVILMCWNSIELKDNMELCEGQRRKDRWEKG
jgi:hypothetical protein